MNKPINYSNDRSFDNLLLILIHTYVDLKSLSNQDDISKSHVSNKRNCMWDINRAYFGSTYLSRKEWDGKNYKDLPHKNEVPDKEIDWFRRTLLLAEEIYEKLENSSNVLDEDLKGLKNYIFDCVSLIYSPYQFTTEKLSINIDTL
jgi:hypothetical protein